MEQEGGVSEMSDTTPWDFEAKYHANGLPANMAAMLRDQWKRRFPTPANHRRRSE
jgi:hypothetical protein